MLTVMKRVLFASLLLLGAALCPLSAAHAEQADVPQVLLIGDSISIGYTPHVKQMLKGAADVTHHAGNAQHTGTGLRRLDQWLGETKWDVIHFNWGLWDLCYRHPESKVQGNRDKVDGVLTTSLDQYQKNLHTLVTRLEATGAKLIWASTTVVPEGEAGRKVGDDKRYNDVAGEVMKKHGIATNDLHSLTRSFSPDLFTGPGNVHYTKAGYKRIARQVAEHVRAAVEGEQAGRVPQALTSP